MPGINIHADKLEADGELLAIEGDKIEITGNVTHQSHVTFKKSVSARGDVHGQGVLSTTTGYVSVGSVDGLGQIILKDKIDPSERSMFKGLGGGHTLPVSTYYLPANAVDHDRLDLPTKCLRQLYFSDWFQWSQGSLEVSVQPPTGAADPAARESIKNLIGMLQANSQQPRAQFVSTSTPQLRAASETLDQSRAEMLAECIFEELSKADTLSEEDRESLATGLARALEKVLLLNSFGYPAVAVDSDLIVRGNVFVTGKVFHQGQVETPVSTWLDVAHHAHHSDHQPLSARLIDISHSFVDGLDIDLDIDFGEQEQPTEPLPHFERRLRELGLEGDTAEAAWALVTAGLAGEPVSIQPEHLAEIAVAVNRALGAGIALPDETPDKDSYQYWRLIGAVEHALTRAPL